MFNIIIYKLNNNEDQEKSSPKDVSSDGLHYVINICLIALKSVKGISKQSTVNIPSTIIN